jgi:transcriptional regulator with XRE-family HTH domain
MRQLGPTLKRLRLERGLTQASFAKKAGISRVYLAQLEGSSENPPIRTPSLRTLERLAGALHVQLTDLLQEEG